MNIIYVWEGLSTAFCCLIGKSIAIHKKGQQRSYIDIDVTDPFKVPKTSEYIDQPIPEYDNYGNRRKEESDHSINYKFDNIKVQTENKADVDEGPNHGEEEHDKYDDFHPGQEGHHFHNNDMQEEGPEVPADQEESPRDVEPDSFPAHDESNRSPADEDEHMPGDSRHNVPKADWKPDDIEPLPDQRGHEESGAPWRNDDAPKNEDYRRHDYNERKFEENEEDKFNDDHEREREHFGGWERRDDHGKDDAQQYMQHDGRHDGPHDGPHEGLHFGPHEEPNEGSHEGPHNGLHELPHGGPRDWEHDGAREEEQRAEVPDDSSKENGKEGDYFDRES